MSTAAVSRPYDIFCSEFLRTARSRGYFGPVVAKSDISYGLHNGRPVLVLDVVSVAS